MVTASEGLFNAVQQLAQQVWEESFPHTGRTPEELRERRYYYLREDEKVEEFYRVKYVDGPDDVAEGDLLIIFDVPATERPYGNKKYINDWLTAREVVRQHTGYLGRVIAKSKAFITVEDLRIPGRGFGIDLALLRVPDWTAQTTKFKGSSASREIGNLGSMDEILRRMGEHPLFADWKAAFETAKEIVSSQRLRQDIEAEERRKRIDAKRIRVARINEALQEDLLGLRVFSGEDGSVKLPEGFTYKRLRTYLRGAAYELGWSVGQGFAVEEDLKFLGIWEN